MKKMVMVCIGVLLFTTLFAQNQNIEIWGDFNNINFTNGAEYRTSSANFYQAEIAYSIQLSDKMMMEFYATNSNYSGRTDYYGDSGSGLEYKTGKNSTHTKQFALIYGYDVTKELKMKVPTYLTFGLGYGDLKRDDPSDIYGYPQSRTYTYFYLPLGVSIVNPLSATTSIEVDTGLLMFVGTQVSYSSFYNDDAGSVASGTNQLKTSLGYYATLSLKKTFTENWYMKMSVFYKTIGVGESNSNINGTDFIFSGREFKIIGTGLTLGYNF